MFGNSCIFIDVCLKPFFSCFCMWKKGFFLIHSVSTLLELLSSKGIFMKWKNSLSLIWFKYCWPQLHSQKLIRNAESFLVSEKLSWQNEECMQNVHMFRPLLPFQPSTFSFSISFLPDICIYVTYKSFHPILSKPLTFYFMLLQQ